MPPTVGQFHPFAVDVPHIVYAALGGFVVFFGMFSLFIREKLYIGEACWAFLFGVIIGPYCANIFNPRGWGNGDEEVVNTITLEFTRVVLAIGVFAIGVELPKAYMQRHWKSLLFLLFPCMTWGWFVSAGLIYALIPKLNFLSSLAIAACLTPTDPILAAAVVGGKYADKHVPAHLRHLLAAESGCNDGAAFPFLYISLYLIVDKSTGKAVEDWFIVLWLYEVILGIVFGALIGWGFRHLMKFCERKDLIDRQSYVAQYVSLALLTIGSTTMLGSDDLLAAFSCGTAFAWDGFFNRQTEESVFSSVIDLLFNVAAFVFVGAWTPFSAFSSEDFSLEVWRLVVIAILVLLLRRLPVMLALYRWIPDVKNFREAIFSGHFGPMGIGAIFISTLAAESLPEPSSPPASQQEILAGTIQPVVSFMVIASILIHGLSIPFFSLGRRVHSVSRTWSRHATLEGRLGPEWANQTRAITRPEDIVINRDVDAVERGEVPEHIRKEVEEGEVESGTSGEEKFMEGVEVGREVESREVAREVGREDGVPVIVEEEREREGSGSETVQGSTHAQGERKVIDEAQDFREENLPDGQETVQEWKEGPHKIIERRAGPGEEVEVEVQQNAYAKHPESGPVTTKAFRGTEGQVHHVAEQFMRGLRQAPKDAEKAMEKVGEAAESAVENLSPHLSPKSTARHSQAKEGEAGPSSASGGIGAGEAAGEDEEEWASDTTAERTKGGKRGGSSPSARHGGKRRLFMQGVGRIGRRKSSAHLAAHGSGSGTRGTSSSRPSSGASTGGLLAGRHSPRQPSPSPGPSTPIVIDYALPAQNPLSLTPTQSIPHIETELAGPSPSTSSSPEDNSPASEETRGPAPSPRPDAGGRRRSRQHQRLETLRRQGGGSFGSRESSPARSVRWADSPSPRSPLPLPPMGEGYESGGEAGESGDEDAGLGPSVRFELPDLGEGGR